MFDNFLPHASFNFKLHDTDPKSLGAWPQAFQNSHTTGSKIDNKSIDVSMPVFARFFLLSIESGVTSMSLNVDGAKERPLPQAPHYVSIDCSNASWTFNYTTGYIVTLKGPLSAVVTMQPPMAGQPQTPVSPLSVLPKIEHLSFDAQKVTKAINVNSIIGQRAKDPVRRRIKTESSSRPGSSAGLGGGNRGFNALGSSSSESTPKSEENEERTTGELMLEIADASIPIEPVNAFGIPQASMRCLEVRFRPFGKELLG